MAQPPVNWVNVIEHSPAALIGDVAFFTVAIYVADATGFSHIFMPVSARTESREWQILRMAALIGSYVEIRRWLDLAGWDTDLVRMLKKWM